jgi:hypothetical protein
MQLQMQLLALQTQQLVQMQLVLLVQKHQLQLLDQQTKQLVQTQVLLLVRKQQTQQLLLLVLPLRLQCGPSSGQQQALTTLSQWWVMFTINSYSLALLRGQISRGWVLIVAMTAGNLCNVSSQGRWWWQQDGQARHAHGTCMFANCRLTGGRRHW